MSFAENYVQGKSPRVWRELGGSVGGCAPGDRLGLGVAVRGVVWVERGGDRLWRRWYCAKSLHVTVHDRNMWTGDTGAISQIKQVTDKCLENTCGLMVITVRWKQQAGRVSCHTGGDQGDVHSLPPRAREGAAFTPGGVLRPRRSLRSPCLEGRWCQYRNSSKRVSSWSVNLTFRIYPKKIIRQNDLHFGKLIFT